MKETKKPTNLVYIKNKKAREGAFYIRMTGLLKKACEMGILCGVKISVSFTDLKGNLHLYQNIDKLSAKTIKSLEMSDKVAVIYKAEEYPFERKYLTKKRKRAENEKQEREMLGKRQVGSKKDYEAKFTEEISRIKKFLKTERKTTGNLIDEIELDGGSEGSELGEEKDKIQKIRTKLVYMPQLKIESSARSDQVSTMETILSRWTDPSFNPRFHHLLDVRDKLSAAYEYTKWLSKNALTFVDYKFASIYFIFMRLYFGPEINNLSVHLKEIPIECFRRILDLKKYLKKQKKGNTEQTPSTTNQEEEKAEPDPLIEKILIEKSLAGGASELLQFSDYQSKQSKFTFKNISFFTKKVGESEIGWLNDEPEEVVTENTSKTSKSAIELKYSDASSMLDFNNNIEVDEEYVMQKESQVTFTFNFMKRVLEILFMIVTRKLRVNSELTFTDDFFKNYPFRYPGSVTGNFFLLQTKTYVTSLIWVIEKGESKTFSQLFSGQQSQEQERIDFLRPKPFTREFSFKSNYTGISIEQRKILLDKANFDCFETISNMLYMGDFFQQGVNHLVKEKAGVAGIGLGDGSKELIIQF